jgi:hypothetical protein
LTEIPWPYAIVACSIGFQVFAGRNFPETFAGEARVGRRAEPRVSERSPHRRRRQRQRDLGGADVRRLLNDLLDRQRAAHMRVVDRVRADGERPGSSLDHRVGADLAALQRRGDREGLQRRARLEHVGERAVAHALARDAVARIGVVRRPVGEREDLSALRVDDDEAAGLRAVCLDGGLELSEREILEPRVDREREIATSLRRADRLDVFDDLAAAVDDHAAAPRFAAQPLLLRELEPFLPDVAIAGEAQDVDSSFRRRGRSGRYSVWS